MKAPHISKRPQLPLVLITTPEITSLPPSLGPLAEIISTQGGGGLGDISGSLITEFDRLGLNVRVVVPEYKKMFERALKKITDVHEGSFEREYNLMKKDMEKSKINLIEDEIFRTAEHVYGDENTMLDQIELRKADAFQEGIISRMLPTLKVDNQNIIVHCNDWTTGIIPAAARNLGIMSLMTVHNIFTYHQTPYGLKKHSIYIEPYWKDLFFKDHPR